MEMATMQRSMMNNHNAYPWNNKKLAMNYFIRNKVLPATSNDMSKTKIALPLKALSFRGYKNLGMFLSPSDVENLDKLPRSKPLSKGQLPSNNIEIHFCFCPEIPTTIIPVETGILLGKHDRLKVDVTQCSLQKGGCEKKYKELDGEVASYSASIKLDFALFYTKDEARRFHLDGAMILDLVHPLLGLPHQICLLGMDFMIKHPHLLLETRLDKRKELTFRLAKSLSWDKTHELPINYRNEVVINVESHIHPVTGGIGCGIFFKTGSVFNFFGGVSRGDLWGAGLGHYWMARGAIVGIIKALQTVQAFLLGGLKPASVIIRTSNAEIEGILSPTKPSINSHRQRSRESPERAFPSTIRDMATYYYDNFVKRNPGFEIKFQHTGQSSNPKGAIPAKILAIAGSEMQEFYMDFGLNCFQNEGFGSYPRKSWPSASGAVPLISYSGVSESLLYVSFGIDGYYLIQQVRAIMVTDLADQASSASIPSLNSQAQLKEALKKGEHTLPKPVDGWRTFSSFLRRPSEFGNDWYVLEKDSNPESTDLVANSPSNQNGTTAKQAQNQADQRRPSKGESAESSRKEWIDSIRREYRNAKAQSKAGDKAVDLTRMLELWKTGPDSVDGEAPSEEEAMCGITCRCRTGDGACLCGGPNSTTKCECKPTYPPPSSVTLEKEDHVSAWETAATKYHSEAPESAKRQDFLREWRAPKSAPNGESPGPSCCAQPKQTAAGDDRPLTYWESIW